MTGFDLSSIIVAAGDGEVCGPGGCLPGEEPTVQPGQTDASIASAEQKAAPESAEKD